MIKLDIGCGAKKREGFTGLDFVAAPGVDHVLNIETDRFPFEDDSVEEIYSSHCFEHLNRPDNVWREISRVIRPGGKIEIITPYCWHNDYLLPGHVSPWSYTQWSQLSVTPERHWYSENFLERGYWKWLEARYLVPMNVQDRLNRHSIPLEIAIHHYVNVVSEWSCVFEFAICDPGGNAPVETVTPDRNTPAKPLAELV